MEPNRDQLTIRDLLFGIAAFALLLAISLVVWRWVDTALHRPFLGKPIEASSP
jgi:hypothetical protein